MSGRRRRSEKEAGVDEVIAGVLPDGKEQVVKRTAEKGQSGHGRRWNQ